MNNLLTAQELAEILKVNEQTIYRWAREGKLPRVKIGSSIRFDREQVRSWLEAQEVEARR
jgi:excisionase family DNA binding protein